MPRGGSRGLAEILGRQLIDQVRTAAAVPSSQWWLLWLPNLGLTTLLKIEPKV